MFAAIDISPKLMRDKLQTWFDEWVKWRKSVRMDNLGYPKHAAYLSERSTTGNQPITRNPTAERLDIALIQLETINPNARYAMELKYQERYDNNETCARLAGVSRKTFEKQLSEGEHYVISKFI